MSFDFHARQGAATLRAPLGFGARLSRDDLPVGDVDDTVCVRGEARVVRDQNDRGSGLAIQGFEEHDYPLTGGAIEVSGGLVGEENARLVHECASERDALLFAAGELGGKMMARGRPVRPARADLARAAEASGSPRSSRGTLTFSSAVSEDMSWKL